MRNLFRFVGFRHLKSKPIRAILTTLGVAFGIALYIAIEIINRSTLASFRESIDAVAGKATLTVTAGEAGFPEGKLELIERTPGVKTAAPMVETRGYFSRNRESNESLEILGIDLLREQGVRTYKTSGEKIIDDPLTFLNQPDSIILTHTFAKAHHLDIDSTFELATAQGTKRFTVRGLLSPEGPAKAYGGDLAIMDIDGARMTFGKEGKLDRVDVVTAAGADVEQVEKNLETTLGPAFTVERPATQSQNLAKMVKSYQLMLTVFSTLALIVGLFLVANSVTIAVAERRREIGTLRALGATRKGILALFLIESTLMGALGALIGVGLGRRLAGLMVDMVTLSMSRQQLMQMEVRHLDFSTNEIWHAILIGGGAAFIAALWPSVRATRISPLEAMRRNETTVEGRAHGFARWSPVLGVCMLIYFGVSSLHHWSAQYPAAGWLDHVCAMLGAAFVGPAIVTILIRILSPIAIPLGGAVVRLANDNLLRNPRRTGSNVMSLMVGLILVTMIATVNVSFRDTILGWYDRLFRADLLVSSTGKLISFQTQPVSEKLGDEISTVPGLLHGPRTAAYGLRFIHLKYQGRQIAMKVYDPPNWANPYFAVDYREGAGGSDAAATAHALFSGQDNIMVSKNFVLHFGKRSGDTIELATPSGLHAFRVVGVMEDFASPEGVLYIDRDVYKKYWKDPLVSVFCLQVAPGADVQAVRSEIDRRFGRSKNLMVVSNRELAQEMANVVDQSFAYTQAIKAAALLVGLLGLFNTFLISVMERTRELGMLRAVGMSRRQMRRMILIEALIQGGFGAVAAVLLGAYDSWLWVKGSLAFVLGWIIDFHFPWAAVGSTLLAGVVVAAAAAIFPAHRAAGLEIREALEYE